MRTQAGRGVLRRRAAARQSGAAMVEFAVSALLMVMVLVTVVEMARFMLLWNTAAEAARLASRLASLCEPGAAQQARIRSQVRYFVEASGQIRLGDRIDWLVIGYLPAGCSASDCVWVEVRLAGLAAPLMVPAASLTLPLPPFRSAQVREAMRNVVAGDPNGAC